MDFTWEEVRERIEECYSRLDGETDLDKIMDIREDLAELTGLMGEMHIHVPEERRE